jgi:hypothetical protein
MVRYDDAFAEMVRNVWLQDDDPFPKIECWVRILEHHQLS